MPITFSITLDVDEELSRFFENLQSGKPVAVTATKPAKKAAKAASPAAPKPPKKAKKAAAAPKPAKKAAKATTKSAPKAAVKAAPKATAKTAVKKAAGPGRKPSLLSPAINKAVEDLAKKGNPFRASDVVRHVMKKNPTFNEGSVTTGVSNHLKTTTLKSEQVKDAVGRPYRLYKG